MIPKGFFIGPFFFHFYGLIIASSIALGWIIARSRSHLYRIPKKLFDDPILLIPLILGLLGARAYHVVDYWKIYSQNPSAIVAIQNGGLGILGGLIGIFVGFWLVAKIRNISFLSLLDLISPSVILGQAIGRIGNYINQEGFGPPTNLPWGVYIDPSQRPLQYESATRFHPTFFYEALIDFFVFLLLVNLSKKITKSGQIFALYLILYSIIRFIVEFWRIDTARIGEIKVAQLLSIIIFIYGFYLLVPRTKSEKREA